MLPVEIGRAVVPTGGGVISHVVVRQALVTKERIVVINNCAPSVEAHVSGFVRGQNFSAVITHDSVSNETVLLVTALTVWNVRRARDAGWALIDVRIIEGSDLAFVPADPVERIVLVILCRALINTDSNLGNEEASWVARGTPVRISWQEGPTGVVPTDSIVSFDKAVLAVHALDCFSVCFAVIASINFL